MFEYGVHIDPTGLPAVRAFLRTSNLVEDEYLARVEKSQVPGAFRPFDSWFAADEDGKEHLYYIRRGSRRLGTIDTPLPRTLSVVEIGWLTSRSRQCAFVCDSGCAVHDVGDPPGPAACRQFLCVTAFVFLLLADQGMTSLEALSGQSMADLHETALAALPLLAAGVSSPEATAARADARQSLALAVASDLSGAEEATRVALARYAAASRSVDEAETRAREAAGEVVRRHTARRTR